MFKKLKKTSSEIKSEILKRKHKKKSSKSSNKNKKHELSAEHLRGKPYNVFLKSSYWATIRKIVLKRDNNQCIVCKSTLRLEIHHDTYKHHFKEHLHLGDLMTLCRNCHKEHHYAQS
jgi:hypothetical protein